MAKILKDGTFTAAFWAGTAVACEACACEFEIEEDDELGVSNTAEPSPFINCPQCGDEVDLSYGPDDDL